MNINNLIFTFKNIFLILRKKNIFFIYIFSMENNNNQKEEIQVFKKTNNVKKININVDEKVRLKILQNKIKIILS